MMPAGKYYVGDLCYVMHDEWDEVCDLTLKEGLVLEGEFNLADQRRFCLYTTAYGDGLYQDQDGREYSVDAGLIGCIRLEDIGMENIDCPSSKNFLDGGHVVEFLHPFEVTYEDGVIKFGNVVHIDTEGDYHDEWNEDGEDDE